MTVRRSLAQQEEYRVREPESREPGTEAGRRLMAGRYSLTVDSLLRDVLEVEAEARQQGRDEARSAVDVAWRQWGTGINPAQADSLDAAMGGIWEAAVAAIDALPVDARRALASADGPPNLTDEEHVAAGHAFRNDADGGHWEAVGPPEPGIDVERLARAIRRVWSEGHHDLRSGLTTDPEDATLAVAISEVYPDA